MKPLYERLDDVSSTSNAPIRGADQLAAVLDMARAWATERRQTMYVYQLWHGDLRGCWTCGAYLPADDPYLRIEPTGEVHLGCDGCGPTTAPPAGVEE